MSVIQNIRDKYARWAVVAIALSLLGFILMDALAGPGAGGLFSGNSTTIGKINGKKLDVDQFGRLMAVREESAKTQGMNMSQQDLLERVWNEEVNNALLEEEYEELGITVTDAELEDMLFGSNPHPELQQAFTNPQTGQFDPNAARQYFDNVRRSNNPVEINRLNLFLDELVRSRKEAKYTSLFTNSIYIAKWMVEKRNADNSLMANVSYVTVPYASIPDTAVKVSDADIQDFINKRKSDFETKEERRGISYVLFPATPSASDSAAARNSIAQLKAQFDTVTNYPTFIERQGSTMPYYDSYISGPEIKHTSKDSILAQPVGTTYGPYLDQSNFILSKIIGVKQWPDTVKVRHILIAYQVQDPQSGQVMGQRDDSTARKLIDSVAALHRSGQSFDSLVVKFSNDFSSVAANGVYDDVTTGKMVAPFNDFIFDNKPGTTGVVKTEYGYHYVEVMTHQGSSPAYKIAYMAKPITISSATENNVYNQARSFAANVNDQASFNQAADRDLKARGITRMVATDIRPIDHSIAGIDGTSRDFIRNVYDADKGDVLAPVKIGNSYIVAVVTEINKPGLQSVNTVRSYIEPILRNRKKAQQIAKSIGNITTLEDVSARLKQPIQAADSVRLGGGGLNPIGYEARVIGAAFNPANKGKVVTQALEGQSGVYVIRVNSTGTTPVSVANIDEQRKMLETQTRQQVSSYQFSPVNTLRAAADIKDYRAKFY
jgi:peptidyl-prolyl cis-trans isomerase D